MAKSFLKIKALRLRRTGHSIKDISKMLGISQSTASVWCRDIQLTQQQLDQLMQSKEGFITAGRLKGALAQKMKRVNALKTAESEAQKIKRLSSKEFFVAGLSLYLAEGSKKMGTVQFTNSDPRLIKFMLKWFNKFYKISKNDITYTVTINITHETRDKKIKKFWQKYLQIKPNLFTKTRFVQTRQNKKYDNSKFYFGTFSFRIHRSTNLLYKINALNDRVLKTVVGL